MSVPRTYRFRPRAFPLAPPPGVGAEDALFELAVRLGDAAGVALLDPGPGAPAGWALLAFDPLPAAPPASLEGLRELLGRLVPEPGDALPPGAFAGGFVGALSYDLGVRGEALSLPPEPWGFPPVVGGLYTDYVARAPEGELLLVLGEEPGDGRPPVGVRRERLAALFGAPSPAPRGKPRPRAPLVQLTGEDELVRRIETVRARIAAGDLYQANLAHRFTRLVDGAPLALYGALRAHHPAPFQGYLRFAEGALLSASPELFLDADLGAAPPVARTRPIKGTIARGATPDADRAAADALRSSAKDLAELAMIVDLERNDLGRVARVGSVRVEGFPRLASYANVHHLLGDVVAEPRADVDAVDLIAALFPGGSITGAPKLASMEWIARLEGEGRGFSFGALGCVDLRGRVLQNLLIRSQLWRPRPDLGGAAGEVAYRVGGGITHASDARAEVEESLVKGARLARALEG